MPIRHLVVDGSNVATEGRQTPSLAQLESALEELRRDFPDAAVTVVVDATFAHRIDPSELDRYQQLATTGALVSPPAGAIGRGDAFLLRIAEKVGATVLSNDSFQEFHGEHPWLFEQGRLLGATPVPGIGWIFSARAPVRGPRSRVATRDARRAQDEVADAIEVATREAVEPEEAERSRPRSRRARASAISPPAVNDPMTFISFIAEHRLGDELEAEVESFTSHGAVIAFGDVRCYVPLSGLGDPPPRSARGMLAKGERRKFVITALDPYRRGIELALPGIAVVSGRPSEETVEAEVQMARRASASPTVGDVATPRRATAAVTTAAPLAPVRSPRARRAATQSIEEEPAATSAALPPAADPVQPPRRRRVAATPKPVAAPVEVATPVAPDPPPIPAPRRTRAPRVVAVAEVAATPAVAAPADRPTTPRRRRAAAAPTEEPTPKAAPETPARRRRAAAAKPRPEGRAPEDAQPEQVQPEQVQPAGPRRRPRPSQARPK